MSTEKRFLLPPWDMDTARQRLQAEEDAWNTGDPEKVILGYAIDAEMRDRTEFLTGREEIKQFLTRKWQKELGFTVKKEVWGALKGRMAVRFEYEWHDAAGQWYRSYGVEVFQFNDEGYVQGRYASADDLPITEADRKLK